MPTSSIPNIGPTSSLSASDPQDSSWLWRGYRWSLAAHFWDRLFVIVIAVSYVLLMARQVQLLTIFTWNRAASGDWGKLLLGLMMLAAALGQRSLAPASLGQLASL
jgi:hypothetical protein